MNNISKTSIGMLCLFWALFILAGIAPGFNAPFILALLGSFLYLL